MTTKSGSAQRLDAGEQQLAGKGQLRLALASGKLRGPDKYEVLALRRRRAQIKARRALDLID